MMSLCPTMPARRGGSRMDGAADAESRVVDHPRTFPMTGMPGSESLRDRVERIINLIRPAVQSDGGDLELISVNDDGVVQVRFHGACVGCPSSTMTLQAGIEKNLRQHIPEVTRVQAVN
jgi:Fe-S cluster biogenesis protein NfuA